MKLICPIWVTDLKMDALYYIIYIAFRTSTAPPRDKTAGTVAVASSYTAALLPVSQRKEYSFSDTRDTHARTGASTVVLKKERGSEAQSTVGLVVVDRFVVVVRIAVVVVVIVVRVVVVGK